MEFAGSRNCAGGGAVFRRRSGGPNGDQRRVEPELWGRLRRGRRCTGLGGVVQCRRGGGGFGGLEVDGQPAGNAGRRCLDIRTVCAATRGAFAGVLQREESPVSATFSASCINLGLHADRGVERAHVRCSVCLGRRVGPGDQHVQLQRSGLLHELRVRADEHAVHFHYRRLCGRQRGRLWCLHGRDARHATAHPAEWHSGRQFHGFERFYLVSSALRELVLVRPEPNALQSRRVDRSRCAAGTADLDGVECPFHGPRHIYLHRHCLQAGARRP